MGIEWIEELCNCASPHTFWIDSKRVMAKDGAEHWDHQFRNVEYSEISYKHLLTFDRGFSYPKRLINQILQEHPGETPKCMVPATPAPLKLIFSEHIYILAPRVEEWGFECPHCGRETFLTDQSYWARDEFELAVSLGLILCCKCFRDLTTEVPE